MSTVKLWTDEEVAAVPAIQAVFDDIRATRRSAFVNNFWRALANQPDVLERNLGESKASHDRTGRTGSIDKGTCVHCCFHPE